ncbi:inorganic phosphate transporter [Marinisporobacter balticus]|uniref:PiT family inorganic phosphate transporter n=1 Tax=Marinisporobacter balticus TaxID=2018667 RepID=A0A4R2KVG9_9FIRM|nr:inorganic phosphate transporter [Marinisporobacter balticus]TCO75179.1 PiT family inorganic phosphate transporter [Marinisporobacter balticus]
MISPAVISGAILGWALGGNDAANCFATAVSTKAIKYSKAVMIIGIFVLLGAILEGDKGVKELSKYAFDSGVDTPIDAFLVMLGAGITVILMTILKFPVSTSQAIIGAIIGCAILVDKIDYSQGVKFFGAWVITPIGAMISGHILYRFAKIFIEKPFGRGKLYNYFIKIGFIIAGAFSAYSLGANNVANVTAVYAGKLNLLTTNEAVVIGGISMAIGALTFSKPVMKTVGNSLTPLSPTAGFIAVLTASIIVYIYAQIGIPVSTSQAMVGSVIGIGLVQGVKTVNFKMTRNILLAWIGTPIVAGLVSFSCFKIYAIFIK